MFRYMEEEKIQTSSSQPNSDAVKILHCKVIGGNSADIYEIGKALKDFKEKLPFRLECIVTNDNVELRDIDCLLKELIKLKKSELGLGDKH